MIESKQKTPRKHHYLSICYQKGFADSEGKVHAYHIPPNSQLINHLYLKPQNVACEKDRYTLFTEDGAIDRSTFERIYSKYENEISKYLKDKYELLKPEAMQKILTFMFHLIHRSSVFWKEAEKQKFYQKYIHADPRWLKSTRLLLACKKYIEKYSDYMINSFNFILIHSTEDIPFVTGDAPAMIGIPGKKVGYFSGLTNNDTEVYFPISSQVCLAGFKKAHSIEKIYLGLNKNITERKNAIKQINKCIVMKSHDLLLSPTKLPESLVLKLGYFDLINRKLELGDDSKDRRRSCI